MNILPPTSGQKSGYSSLPKQDYYARFEILTAGNLKVTVFWDVEPYNDTFLPN
jgi:hypothetical protein